MATQEEKNIQIALALLEDERTGDIRSALSKMHPEYSMTWVYKSKKGTLFPKQHAIKVDDLKDVYAVEGRKYYIKNIVASKDIVMIEMIESYPDSESKKLYRTPQVIVLEFKEEKVIRGRHYCDPQVSYLDIDDSALDNLYK